MFKQKRWVRVSLPIHACYSEEVDEQAVINDGNLEVAIGFDDEQSSPSAPTFPKDAVHQGLCSDNFEEDEANIGYDYSGEIAKATMMVVLLGITESKIVKTMTVMEKEVKVLIRRVSQRKS